MDITLISVPFDQDMYDVSCGKAPALLKQAGLIERLREHSITVREETSVAHDLGAGDRVERLGRLGRAVADRVVEAYQNKTMPVILGGDCINCIGVSAGLRRALGPEDFGIAWFDAHGDFNTPETTLSGYLGGMPLAASCGRGLDDLREHIGLMYPINEEHIVMLGIRDLDPPEKELLDTTPISYLSPAEVVAGRTAPAAQYHFQNVHGVYLHFDSDVLDPDIAPAMSYPAPHGLSIEEVIAATQTLQEATPILAYTFSAWNPDKDKNEVTLQTSLQTLVGMLAALQN